MKQQIKLTAALIVLSAAALQNVRADVVTGEPTALAPNQVIEDAIDAGRTIDAVVFDLVSQQPNNAKQIVTAAVSMLPVLPAQACPVAQSEFTERRLACEDAVIQAAVAAGADPSAITAAAAAGSSNPWHGRPAHKNKVRVKHKPPVKPFPGKHKGWPASPA